MTTMKFATFLSQIAQVLRQGQGPELAYLLKPTSEHGKHLVKEFRSPTVRGLSSYPLERQDLSF